MCAIETVKFDGSPTNKSELRRVQPDTGYA